MVVKLSRDEMAVLRTHEGRKTPWETLGESIEGSENSEEAMRRAGLDWDVALAKTYSKFQKTKITNPNIFNVIRATDGQLLGSVGRRYHPLQNREAFRDLDALFTEGTLTYVSAGSLLGGTRVFILARMGRGVKIGGRDPIQPYILLHTSHDGSHAVTVKLTDIRVASMSLVTVALKGRSPDFKLKHTRNLQERMREGREELDRLARLQAEQFNIFEHFAQTKASEEDIERAMEILSPTPPETASELIRRRAQEEKLQLWKELAESPSVVFAGGSTNLWGVYTLATQFIDWTEPRKGMSGEMTPAIVEKRALYSLEGQGSTLRQRVFDLFLEKV